MEKWPVPFVIFIQNRDSPYLIESVMDLIHDPGYELFVRRTNVEKV
jgi:hypothetical protein